jgi:hypothetical protein
LLLLLLLKRESTQTKFVSFFIDSFVVAITAEVAADAGE